eukprot:COSAG06_NODE_40155_length_404_cov_13.655738_1_plen_134_part_11
MLPGLWFRGRPRTARRENRAFWPKRHSYSTPAKTRGFLTFSAPEAAHSAFPAPVILRRGGRASSPSKRYCGRLRVIYTSSRVVPRGYRGFPCAPAALPGLASNGDPPDEPEATAGWGAVAQFPDPDPLDRGGWG